jgi:GNAT superfamily N-acetyltransferase
MISPAEVRIRTATPDDIEAMVELLSELFSVEEDFVFDPLRQARGLLLLLGGCGKHKVVKVAETSGGVVGMATAQMVISTAEGGMAVWVEDVVVKSGWRGKGIGRALLNRICGWGRARGITRFQLLADRNNPAALEFYKKNGWAMTQLCCMRYRIEDSDNSHEG